jgi:branched-chain amino acid transport system permease protein
MSQDTVAPTAPSTGGPLLHVANVIADRRSAGMDAFRRRWGNLPKPARLTAPALLLVVLILLPVWDKNLRSSTGTGIPVIGTPNTSFSGVLFLVGAFALCAIGLNVVVGFAGLLDLGYVGFYAVGAYSVAVFGSPSSQLAVAYPWLICVPIGLAIAMAAGVILGGPTLRLRGDYLAIVTLAFGEMFQLSARNNIGGLTGGSNAIPNIPPLEGFGTKFNESINLFGTKLPSGVVYYFLIVVLVALVMAVFANLKNSRMGRAWIAIREDEDAARAMGIKTGQAKILAFLCGAVLAGIAGAVFAHKTSSVGYESFQFMSSVTLLAAVILGGMGSIPGAVLGASLLFVLPEKLREFSDYRLLFFGIALILIMRFRPHGLVPDKHRRAELVGEDASGHSLEEVAEERIEEADAPKEVTAR